MPSRRRVVSARPVPVDPSDHDRRSARCRLAVAGTDRLCSCRLVQQRPARQPRPSQRNHAHARPSAPRNRPVGTDVAVIYALRPHRVQGSLVPNQRVVAVDQARQHMVVATDTHRRRQNPPPHTRPCCLRLASPPERTRGRDPHGVRRLRHATTDAPRDQSAGRDARPGIPPTQGFVRTKRRVDHSSARTGRDLRLWPPTRTTSRLETWKRSLARSLPMLDSYRSCKCRRVRRFGRPRTCSP
jgi:hypothetical protein